MCRKIINTIHWKRLNLMYDPNGFGKHGKWSWNRGFELSPLSASKFIQV